MTPEGEPAAEAGPGLAVQFVINGNGTSIHCSPYSAAPPAPTSPPAYR